MKQHKKFFFSLATVLIAIFVYAGLNQSIHAAPIWFSNNNVMTNIDYDDISRSNAVFYVANTSRNIDIEFYDLPHLYTRGVRAKSIPDNFRKQVPGKSNNFLFSFSQKPITSKPK